MRLKRWEDLPPQMQTEAVRSYYDCLRNKQGQLLLMRMFDIIASAVLLVLLFPLMLILALIIKLDSPGPIFYRQLRVTQYGKHFRIFKFRTMVTDADRIGTQVTVAADNRVTRVGKFLRKTHLDELGQLIDVLRGTMSFVGTRPEVPQYVAAYTPEMMATLLLPAGITSLTSILFEDEAQILQNVQDADAVYIHQLLPQKMVHNLAAVKNFTFWGQIKLLFMTVFAVLGADYSHLA